MNANKAEEKWHINGHFSVFDKNTVCFRTREKLNLIKVKGNDLNSILYLIVTTKQVTTHSLKIDHEISLVSLNEIDALPT